MVPLTVSDAAEILGLPESGIQALIRSGYLATEPGSGSRVPLSELKAFQARNSPERGDTADIFAGLADPDVGADVILDALEATVDDLARQATDIVSSVFPDAARWTDPERETFERQSRDRFGAIITVTRCRHALDDDLFADLADAGADAAGAGARLPEVLLTLRISRDLLVQAAVGEAESRGGSWGQALTVVLTRILPVLDRLSDTVARGYWSTLLKRNGDEAARYEHVVEHSAAGIYELDLDGHITYVNPSMAALLGSDRAELAGRPLYDLLPPNGGTAGATVFHTPTVTGWRQLCVRSVDGVVRDLMVQISERIHEGAVVGFSGVVHDVTAGARPAR